MSEWRPIETAPVGTLILLCVSGICGQPLMRVGWYLGGMCVNPSTGKSIRNPTHWMPLPEPPKEK